MSALRVTGLVKRYGNRVAVDALDLSIEEGECLGLLGPNGAGKTTTLESILGLVEPDAGDIELLGLRQPRDRQAIRERVGVALQETKLHEKLTVYETLLLFRSFYREGSDEASLLARMDLAESSGVLVGALSGGQRQRLGLACALIGDPELVILDEPSTGLDPDARHRLWDGIEQLGRDGRTVLITTHFMEEAERLCDRVLIMNQGQLIAEGTTRELTTAHVGSHVVELEQTDGELDIEAVRDLDAVRVARTVGQTMRVGTDAPDAVMAALTRACEVEQVRVGRLARGPATLEDVFLVLSGRSLSDAP